MFGVVGTLYPSEVMALKKGVYAKWDKDKSNVEIEDLTFINGSTGYKIPSELIEVVQYDSN